MATFEINKLRGSFDGKTWTVNGTGPDAVAIKTILEDMAKLYTPDGSYRPDRTADVVRFVMNALGGRLIEPGKPDAVDDVPGRVYQKLDV